MTIRIPPIQCLLTFEALARLRSVTQTADELCVTPSAVSHRIRQLEQILGTPPPPAPPNVPELDAQKQTSGTLRQRMEQHRENPSCAGCHARMDPLGFGLENFDAVGAWRTKDGEYDVDASGKLPDGRSFNGPSELRQILTADRDAFTVGMTERMLTYALGRGLEAYDRRTVRSIAHETARNDYRFSSLVAGIVKSLPFQHRQEGESQ